MARVKIPFRGQTANKEQDGDCRTIVNLRPSRRGTYKPVPARQVLKNLTREYNHMFVHKGSTYENWIGVEANRIYVNVEEANEVVFETEEPINSIEQIGNVVVLVCASVTSYLLWVDGEYRFLGELPELPVFEVSITDEVEMSLTYKAGGVVSSENSEPVDINSDEAKLHIISASKQVLYRTRELISKGGKDGSDVEHSAKGEYLYDAHIMRYAYRLYDGTVVKHSPPILLMPGEDITLIKRVVANIFPIPFLTAKVYTYAYRPTLKADAWYNEDWKHIIKSVDVYLSPALNISSIENIIDLESYAWQIYGSNFIVKLIKQDKAEALRNITECGTLYLLKSIPYEKGVESQTITLLTDKQDEDAIKNIQFSELMPVDTGSNHKIGSKASYVYNNRIHLANIKTTFFKGFTAKSFAISTNYNGASSLVRPIGGGTSLVREWTDFEIAVTISVDGKDEVVITKYTPRSGEKCNITSMISYPDPRAKRMRITAVEVGTNSVAVLCDVALVEHKYLNVAYHVDGDLKPIGERYELGGKSVNTTDEIISYEYSKLKVSAINNPFIYPNANTYQIGNDKILTLASQAQKISEGSFGQYPLYIFTTTGIYSLQIGQGEVLYSNQVAPVSYETPVSEIVAETPYGIIFISNRGLCSISGQQVELVSESIDQMHDYINIHDSDIVEVKWPDVEFEEYLANAKSIIYNPYHDELIITSADCEYNYVYNIPTQSFWLSTEDISVAVRNTFPELYVIGSNALKTMKESRDKSVRVAIITHPIDFGSSDIKRMQRALLSGLLVQANVGEINAPKPKKMLVGVYNSLDEVNFNLSRGVMLQQDGSYKDLDLGLMARTKSRYFLVAIAGTINESSKVEYSEFELVEEYNNDKMR